MIKFLILYTNSTTIICSWILISTRSWYWYLTIWTSRCTFTTWGNWSSCMRANIRTWTTMPLTAKTPTMSCYISTWISIITSTTTSIIFWTTCRTSSIYSITWPSCWSSAWACIIYPRHRTWATSSSWSSTTSIYWTRSIVITTAYWISTIKSITSPSCSCSTWACTICPWQISSITWSPRTSTTSINW